jgi:hypothetical protein
MTIARAATLAASVLMIASCSKLRGVAGTGSAAPQASQTSMTVYEGGEAVHVLTGPLPSRSGKDQTWHAQPYRCGFEEKLLGMCGDSPHAVRTPAYVPTFHIPAPPRWKPSPAPRLRRHSRT